MSIAIKKSTITNIINQVLTISKCDIIFTDNTSLSNITPVSITLREDNTNKYIEQVILINFTTTTAKTLKEIIFKNNNNSILFKVSNTLPIEPGEIYLTVVIRYAYQID